jgi:transposase
MILDLARQGLSVSAIARRTGHDRKTIRKYIERGLEPPLYKPRDPAPSRLRQREGTLRERLRFLCRPQLLIVDEIGYLPVIPGGGNLFFQLVAHRPTKY